METVTFTPPAQPQTKQCPFCAETIQAAAVKCRFCGEFLNTDRAKSLKASSVLDSQSPEDEAADGNVLFRARPSLWGMAGTAIRGLLFIAVAVFLFVYPLENLSVFQSSETEDLSAYNAEMEEAAESDVSAEPAEEMTGFELTEEQTIAFTYYRKTTAVGLACLVVLIILMKMVRLKMICYEVTANRIEYSRGVLDRKIDNLDMFRVIDLKLRRTLLDCMLGIGTVGLITTDKTDPEFTFEKLRNCRLLYDIIKKASLAADRRTGVVHLE